MTETIDAPAAREAASPPGHGWQRSLNAVPAPRATRKLALLLLLLFGLLPVALLVVPWQQNVSSTGRVTALLPLDRVQTLPAPVSGRLVQLLVQEGQRVVAGQKLAELEDQDPQYTARLGQQLSLAEQKLEAAQSMVAFYDQQLVFLEDAREQAVSEATFQLGVAIEKVRAAEQELYGDEAQAEQKLADRERKLVLWQSRVVSELDWQKAEAEHLSAKAKVQGAVAKVEQARNEESAKMAAIGKVANDQLAKIESTKSAREDARGKANQAEKELTEASTKLERQRTQVVVAPRDGTVLRVHAAATADLLSQGQPLIEFIPDTEILAVELWARGVDAPLITPGRKVRLQFEGWPAVQFAGWPSVAVGTFGGEVALVDAQGTTDGRFRVLVVPDPDDAPWPNRRILRQGGRASGWVLLDQVSLGYELWRQLNAFPPSIQNAPDSAGLFQDLSDKAAGTASGKGGAKQGGGK